MRHTSSPGQPSKICSLIGSKHVKPPLENVFTVTIFFWFHSECHDFRTIKSEFPLIQWENNT